MFVGTTLIMYIIDFIYMERPPTNVTLENLLRVFSENEKIH